MVMTTHFCSKMRRYNCPRGSGNYISITSWHTACGRIIKDRLSAIDKEVILSSVYDKKRKTCHFFPEHLFDIDTTQVTSTVNCPMCLESPEYLFCILKDL